MRTTLWSLQKSAKSVFDFLTVSKTLNTERVKKMPLFCAPNSLVRIKDTLFLERAHNTTLEEAQTEVVVRVVVYVVVVVEEEEEEKRERLDRARFCADIRWRRTKKKKKEEEEEDKTRKVLKCVCFHGFSQNADAFRRRTGSIRTTKLKRKYEFVFLDAPHAVDGVFGEEDGLREEEPK